MAKTWGDQTYNEDWEPIDAMGNKTGGKDWAANRDWNAQNDPGQINNFSPDVLAQTGGVKPAPTGSGAAPPFAWDNPGDFGMSKLPGFTGNRLMAEGYTGSPSPEIETQGGALSVVAPTLDAAALMSQLQGPSTLGQVQGPQALGQVSGPASLGQVQGPAALGQVQGPAALQQLGAAPTVAAAGPTSQFGQSVQQSVQQGLSDPTVDTNSPAYKAQIEAFNRNSQRSAERLRAANAQRANAQGTLGSGGFDASVNRVLQNQGADEANFEAQLMRDELNAGRDRQARSQQIGAGLLSQEQQQGLTERLANQSGALTGMGLNNQRDLSNQQTGVQMAGLNSGRDLANLGAQMQTQGLNSGREQSNQQAGLQMAGLNSGRDVMNQQALMQLLGLNNSRDMANQAAQLQTMGLNNQRDLTSYGAQNQRDLASYGGQLQTGLANQGARLTQRGYNLQRDLGLRDLDLRGQQIGNQNNQFYDQLGQQLGLSTADMNQRAMLALLGGG